MAAHPLDLLPAYVLHARPYRETSLLLELLVMDLGRVGAVARGVRGSRSAARRAALQPLQPLLVGLSRRGELAALTHFEAASQPLPARGDGLLACLYVNELCLRLMPRDEPDDGLFRDYARCVAELADGGDLASPLRRIERRLLEVAGYGLDLEQDTAGRPLRGTERYWLDEDGRLSGVAPAALPSVAGEALLALQAERAVPAAEAVWLRRLLRQRLIEALGPKPLRCWGLLDELAELGRAQSAPAESSSLQATTKS